MVKKIAIVVLGLLAALLISAATRPDSFRVERSTSITAPPEDVFPLINDLHRWVAWSPWEKMDPAMKRTHRGATHGEGAVYEWDGNGNVGQGRMEITESIPPSRIRIKLDFIEPFQAQNTAEFILEDEDDSTRLTWAMYGRNSFMAKVMQLFLDVDGMIGEQFEAGLANLRGLAEG
jgi:uncharacterized protein YndB with AHSA1/START domain